jgi:hypothetical protein
MPGRAGFRAVEPSRGGTPPRPRRWTADILGGQEKLMDYKRVSFGLGLFSLALGAAELFGAKKITGKLDADGHEGLVKGFGARELAAGVSLLAAPAVATNVWNRVAGDAMDLVATSLAVANSPKNKWGWGAVAFVVGAAVIDVVTAIGLDKQTGKTSPAREELTPA